MVDANGELKPFERFLNDVQSIEKRYNSNYLRAEYNFAVASAQSASQWEQIAADGDRFDLQYRTAGDSKVRPAHAALDGVTLPPSSPFWDSFMPPNGWNCRCSAVQVRRGKYPHIDVAEALALGEEAIADDKRGMLRFNPGKLGKTFPDYNPYTISRCRDCDVAKGKSTFAKGDTPDNISCNICKNAREQADDKFGETFAELRKRLIADADKKIKESAALETKRLYQTKSSYKRGIGHTRSKEEAKMFDSIAERVDEFVFIRTAELGEGKDLGTPKDQVNIDKKRKRGVVAYNHYLLRDGEDIWVVTTEKHKSQTEAVYNIYKKE